MNSLYIYLIVFCSLFLHTLNSDAQVQEHYPPYHIQSIQFESSGKQDFIPVFELGTRFSLSFDDLEGNEKNYYYRIQHYNFDWTSSDLSKNEYLDGFDEVRIKNYANSQNTLQPYSHYELSIPNADIKAIKRSGNYLVEILDRNFNTVFSKKFMITERLAQVSVEIKRSLDLQNIERLQVVHFSVQSKDLIFLDPKNSVKISLFQNGNLFTGIHDLKPQYTVGNDLIYKYYDQTSFYAGNEYLYFDTKDVRATGNGISRVDLTDIYNHHVYIDKERKNKVYTKNPDINGAFVIRSLDASSVETGAEYTRLHFSLAYDPNIGDKEIHIYGAFNNFNIDDTTYLKWNKETGVYEGSRLFKQGFYNYKYVTIDADGYIDENEIDGNYWQTENQYDVLVYYRASGERYDRLIGLGTGNSIHITN